MRHEDAALDIKRMVESMTDVIKVSLRLTDEDVFFSVIEQELLDLDRVCQALEYGGIILIHQQARGTGQHEARSRMYGIQCEDGRWWAMGDTEVSQEAANYNNGERGRQVLLGRTVDILSNTIWARATRGMSRH